MIIELKDSVNDFFLAGIAEAVGSKAVNGVIHLPSAVGTGFIRGFHVSPDLHLIIRRYELKADCVLRGMISQQEKTVVMIAFHNIFKTDDAFKNHSLPSIQVTTAGFGYEVLLPGSTKMNALIMAIKAEYLQSLLEGEEGNKVLQAITSQARPFLVEELLSPQIREIASAIAAADPPETLSGLYYRVKAEELIYLLFVELLKRRDTLAMPMNAADVRMIYQVRGKILSQLAVPPSLKELAQFAGMSESKLKRLFKQIFGKTVYNYYQSFRMREAAYLIRVERLSVTETGYRLGFTNLSHFARTFEAHVGLKPKKYAARSI